MWNNADFLHFMYDNMIADVAFQPKINVWREETSVQLHGMSIRQELTIGDFRQQAADKYQLLADIARTHTQLRVLVRDVNNLPQELLQEQLAPYVDVQAYSETQGDLSWTKGEAVVLLDYPAVPLDKLVKQLRGAGVRKLFLLYKQQEYTAFMAGLPLHYPRREEMTVAYKLVMELLQRRSQLSLEELLTHYGEQLSENAIKIMAELGFVSLNNGIIKRNVIKRCQLEDSPLFVELQAKRQIIEAVANKNLRLSEYDLLRG